MVRMGLGTFSRFSVLMLGLVSAGCSLLPAAGPTTSQLEGSTGANGPAFNLVNVDERIAAILHTSRRATLGSVFTQRGYVPSNRLEPGDVVGITVYESGGSSLFGAGAPGSSPAAPTPGTPLSAAQPAFLSGVSTNIPAQTIESDGTILVPFVGRMKAANKTPSQLGAEIQKSLEGKTVEPQVLVTLIGNATNTATVGGDVASPRTIGLTLRGERLLDVIASAGGSKYPAYETYVSLVRGKKIATVLLQTVVVNPSENISIRPNDQIFLTRYPRSFAVLGATQKVSQYTFDTATVTLAEAVARAGGPVDTIGDPAGVYLFRYEPVAVADKILETTPTAVSALASAEQAEGVPSNFVPMLYKVDLRTAGGYFLAQDIAMQDKDVVLITNAEAVQIQKLLVGVRGFTGIAYDLAKQAN